MSYATYMEKAEQILESARAILNDKPDERQLQRARAAITLAEAYGRLASIASRKEREESR
ncbi:hypothetical protein OHB41_51815 [Streptomyces sp. NBC_01571]|uniref:hypothetical protein n=1 Tax=Streptomyces sp. NBC_01571 TaxID=2975883 RepID=UPI002252E26F|nr:hypothetical protein [Streptomyces sp. NBC_01571]MCX4581448.1 hypothetical protein [Streptomyces sp. NBC_01571]